MEYGPVPLMGFASRTDGNPRLASSAGFNDGPQILSGRAAFDGRILCCPDLEGGPLLAGHVKLR